MVFLVGVVWGGGGGGGPQTSSVNWPHPNLRHHELQGSSAQLTATLRYGSEVRPRRGAPLGCRAYDARDFGTVPGEHTAALLAAELGSLRAVRRGARRSEGNRDTSFGNGIVR